MRLNVARRTSLVEDLLERLHTVVPGAEALVRGSLAKGRADTYSDIDLLWDVPDAEFIAAIEGLPAMLSRVRPMASLRFDPDFQRSKKRRLVFVRFADLPLFWRVDLDIFARSIGRDTNYDRENPAAGGVEWPLTESALMNGIAAIKAYLRGRDDEASELLARAERRMGIEVGSAPVPERIRRLTSAATKSDSATRPLAAAIERLVADAF